MTSSKHCALTLGSMLVFAVAFGPAHAATAFVPNSQPTGWVAEVELSNDNLSSNTETIYRPYFARSDWSGNLFAFPVSSSGVVDFTHERWGGGAAAKVNGQRYDSGRKIVTVRGDNGRRIPFLLGSVPSTSGDYLDATQQNSLSTTAATALKVLNYVRGKRDDESNYPGGTGNFRQRTVVLGDIVHSRPYYVPDASKPRVYVGANDGMLHAFNAATGTEEFAYIPSMVIPSLVNLTTDGDPVVHRYFVDASPNVANTGSQTVLVGSLGAGGAGLYALDVTPSLAESDEATLAANRILWEITPTTRNYNNAAITGTSYADLGNSYGPPLIGKVKTSATTTGWVAIVANGYNNNGGVTANMKSVLYVINLADGSLLRSFRASAGTGLSAPRGVDVDGNGTIDYVYAGDIDGNLWKFDLTNSAPTSWPLPTLLYTTNPAQAITGAPSIWPHSSGGYMVDFATGRMFTNAATCPSTGADNCDTTTFYVYGLRDNGTTVQAGNLVAQTLTEKASGSYRVRTSSSLGVDYTTTGGKQGWKLALPAGERVVGDGGLIKDGRYIFTATNPTIVHSKDNSGNVIPNGENWLIEVAFDTGGGGATPIFDINADGALNASDLVATDAANPVNPATGIPVARLITYGVLSQPVDAQMAAAGRTYFNWNPDVEAAPPSVGGVAGGHFDFDIYYPVKSGTPCATSNLDGDKNCNNTHVHQYDDAYNVTGVDMQNASDARMNLDNAVTGTGTKFKLLMANQRLSPAVRFWVGENADYIEVFKYLTPRAVPAPPTLGTGSTLGVNTPFSDALPVYSRVGQTGSTHLAHFVLNMPLDAFAEKNWAGTTPADSRVGLIPTQTGCVRGNDQGGTVNPYGSLWMNGALLVQVIKDTTPDSAIQLESTLGTPDKTMGYRLKSDTTSQKNLLAEYTIFWHHDNGFCYGDKGWGTTAAIAPPMTNVGDTKTPAAGATDPKGGDFQSGGCTVNCGGGSGGQTTVQQGFVDGAVVMQGMTRDANQFITVTTTYTKDGTSSSTPGPTSGGGEAGTQRSGRLSWKQLIR